MKNQQSVSHTTISTVDGWQKLNRVRGKLLVKTGIQTASMYKSTLCSRYQSKSHYT